MDQRKILLISVISVFFLSTAAADVNYQVETTEPTETCAEDYQLETLLSLNSSEGGHVGDAGYYDDYSICVEAESTDIRSAECQEDENTMFSMYKENDTHISTFENGYDFVMCSENLETEAVSDTQCDEGTKVASLANLDDTHVAYPSHTEDPYDSSLCVTTRDPENVTLEMEGFSTEFYADGETISEGEEKDSSETDFPYIVTDNPVGIVSRGDFVELSRPEDDKIRVTQNDGSFLVPNTVGGFTSVDDEQTGIQNREFLDRNEASFAFVAPSNPTVRVMYSPEREIEGFDRVLPRNFELALQNSPDFDTAVNIEPR